MKWYQEERLALWERLYALEDTSEFGEAVVERYTKWTMRRLQQGKMARHRYLRFVDAMKRCHEEHGAYFGTNEESSGPRVQTNNNPMMEAASAAFFFSVQLIASDTARSCGNLHSFKRKGRSVGAPRPARKDLNEQ